MFNEQWESAGSGADKDDREAEGDSAMNVNLLPLKKISIYLNSGISRPFFSEEHGIPVLRSNNVKNGAVNIDDLKFWHEVDPRGANLENVKPEYGDLLVNFVNGSSKELGKAGVYRGVPENCIVSTNFFILRLNKQQALVEYVSYFFQSYLYKKWLYTVAGFSGQGSFNKAEFEKLKIPIPPLPEQKAIADLLSTWDEAIEKTERLTLAKEKRLSGLIQKKIGKRAVDEKGWPEVQLGKLFDEVTRKVGEKDLTPYSISAGIGFVSQREKWGKDISGAQHKNYTHLKAGEFAYNKGNSKRYKQGCVYLLKDGEICVPNVFISFKPKAIEVVPEFFEHYFIADYHARELKRYISSGARSDGLLNLNKRDFFKIKVPSPPPEEQQQLAETLSLAQKEIDLLKQLAEKYKTQKRSLMQKMLTGEWRIKEEMVMRYE